MDAEVQTRDERREGYTVCTARKAHVCQFCGGTIEPGERYGSYQGTPWSHPENDHFFTFKGHDDPCWKAWYEIADDCDGYLPDDPRSWQVDYLDGGEYEDAGLIHQAWLKVTAVLREREAAGGR